MAQMERKTPESRAGFARLYKIETRWRDMDIYGHVNNAVHYELSDSVMNRALIAAGAMTRDGLPVIGLVAQSGAQYFAELAYPEPVEVGLRVERLGTSSVTYGFGLFAESAEISAAHVFMTHVYVHRDTRKPMPLSPALRAFAEGLKTPA